MPGQFRSNVWDPVLIICQIVAMQCQFYVTLGLWVYVLNFIFGYDTTVQQLFKQAVRSYLLCFHIFNIWPCIANFLNCSGTPPWHLIQMLLRLSVVVLLHDGY